MGTSRPVVVGFDGSANARRAAVVAAEVADRLGAPLRVVHAVGLTELVDGRRVASAEHRADIDELVAGWRADLRAELGDLELDLLDGPPVDVLLRVAGDQNAALIVVGRRGAGGRPELLLGSTAHQVVEHARVPVLVVPPIGRSATVVPERS